MCVCVCDSHFNKLNGELAVEGGHLPQDTQLPPLYGERYDLVVSRAVTDSIEYIQVLHHHVSVHPHVKHLGQKRDRQ